MKRHFLYVPLVVNGERKPRKMCNPDSLDEKLFRICYAHPISGHIGINKTSRMLAVRFYWLNLYTPFRKQFSMFCIGKLCLISIKGYVLMKGGHIHQESNFEGKRLNTGLVRKTDSADIW